MLLMSGGLANQAVMSLRLGAPIARAVEPIIDPHNLKIVGWWCIEPDKRRSILLTEDVRQRLPQGLAVNDETVLVEPSELVRHKTALEIEFHLVDKPVKTKRQKLGKVADYAYNEGWFVQKLYINRSFLKGLTADSLIIDRSQIIEITDDYILVKDTEVFAEEAEANTAAEAVPAA